MGVMDLCEVYVEVAGSLCIYFKLCCLVVGDLFSVHQAERFAQNGKVKVMLTKVCSLSSVYRVCCRRMVLVKGRTWETSSEPH